MTLIYIIECLFVVIFLSVFVVLCIGMWTSMRAKVPFVPVPNSILADIHTALNIQEGSVVYDLGCGDGRVLFYSAKRMPRARYIGIDNNPFAIMLAHIRQWWHKITKHTDVEIINGDFFKTDLSNATHIFTYLYPSLMDDLLPKFDTELKKGTRLISTTFQFTLKRPVLEIDLKRKKYKLARKLYVYEF
jgi:SAM-dependent methyltransferase